MAKVVYFSKMFQAAPQLVQVAEHLPGTLVSNRRSTLNAVTKLYPHVAKAQCISQLGPLNKGNRLLKQADVIVTGASYEKFLAAYPQAKKCSVFHGTAMMVNRQSLKSYAGFDLLFAIGPRMQQMMSRFADELPFNTVTTGFLPFGEFPEQSPMQKTQALLQLGLNPDNQTVVYTPSRRGFGSWDILAAQLIEQLPKQFNLVLRPHPTLSVRPKHGDRTNFKRLQAMANRRANTLLDLTSYPLPLLQSVADLMVSDANSPAEESLFYDVPQLFIENPKLSRQVIIEMAHQKQLHPEDLQNLLGLYDCGPSIDVSNTYHLVHEIEQAIANQARYQDNRQNYFSWVFGERDRNAGLRVAEAIKTLL